MNDDKHLIYTGCVETYGDYLHPCYYTVDPTTLGRFTALLDKNENKIFEGDIIRNYRLNEECFVFWNDETLTWEMALCGTSMNEINHFTNTRGLTDIILEGAWGDKPSYEVIGNIYDDPKLANIPMQNNDNKSKNNLTF